MTRVGHLFDATSGWQQRVGAQQLLKGPSKSYPDPVLILVDGSARRQLGELQNDAALVPRRIFALPTAPQLARVLAARKVDVIHAWGLRAAAAAAFTAPLAARPLVLSWFEPQITDRQARLLRTIGEHARCAIACATATVRRRLIEKGIPPDGAVVIRPGVDFGMINQARRSDLRMRLGLQPQQRLLIAPEPATRAGGQFVLFWAAAIRSFIEPHLRVLIPGDSPEQRRIARLARQIGFARHLICPGAGVPFEELVSVADVLVVASEGEV
ncbi:MAG TPA: glycosyltransferase, partial [Phycisphaerae bacterium]